MQPRGGDKGASARRNGSRRGEIRRQVKRPDGERYTKSFSYFDVVRNNGGGSVWEYIYLDVSNASDIEMLWAIADSEETIARFAGDDYSYDLTVTDTDKAALRDAMTVYEAFQ